MPFMAWLSAIDELLYELMSWILFLPITLWRTLRHPLGMMDYADAELTRPDEKEQFQDTLSPPLFLVLCLLIAHGLGLSVGQADAIVASKHGLAGLVNDQTSLLLLRIVLFGSFPLFMAARLARKQRVGLTRATLKPAFYAHCYPVGVLALVLGADVTALGLRPPYSEIVGVVVFLAALLVYGVVVARWFAHRLGQPFWRGFVHASFGMAEGLAMTILLALLFRP